jgi:hypothetical protein
MPAEGYISSERGERRERSICLFPSIQHYAWEVVPDQEAIKLKKNERNRRAEPKFK